MRARVGVDAGDDVGIRHRLVVAAGGGRPDAHDLLLDHRGAVAVRDLGGGIGTPVVDDDHTIRGVRLRGECFEAFVEEVRIVPARNHDRDLRNEWHGITLLSA